MGISTSGSLLIIFFGAFIALGAVYTVTANTTDELTEAYAESVSAQTEIDETAVDVDAVYHEPDGNLTVRVDNLGSTELSVSQTDVLVDGEYVPLSAFEITTVDGRTTDVWGLDQQLRLENESDRPERVKVVTASGVAEAAAVVAMGVEHSNQQTLDRSENETESTITFDVESSYDEAVTLLDVTVETVENEDPAFINYTHDDRSEVNITRAPDHNESVASADGNFTVGETIAHGEAELEPESELRYAIGEFRESDGEPVAMPDTVVTVTLTYQDPDGVERTYTFTEEEF